MPTIRQIFGTVKDFKRGQCSHVKPIDISPYIRRCTTPVAKGLAVCKFHSVSITYKTGKTRKTSYFDDIASAERFRSTIPDRWIETNYTIPPK